MPSRPEFLRLLIVLVPVLIVMIRNYRTGRNSLIHTAGSWRPDNFYDLYMVKNFFSSLGLLVFLVFSVLSLSGFPGKETPVSYEPAGTDVVFAVDISESMKARDIVPSRLDAAAKIIRSVCENTPGGRFGVVVFRGRGVKMIPSTEDLESIYSFLEFLGTDLLTSPGSSLEAGISTALSAFPKIEERKKYIILITDGEALSGELDPVLVLAADDEVSIFCIGAGTPGGAKIISADGSPLTDSSGNVVISRLDEQTLRTVAESTGGKYYPIDDTAVLPDLIRIASGTVDENKSGYKIVIKENYRFFLIIALLGLLTAKFVKVVKWKRYF